MATLHANPAPVISTSDASGFKVGIYQSLESAYVALAQSGGEITLGPGTYTLPRVIELNKSNVTIRGAGSSTVLVCEGVRQYTQTNILANYSKTWTFRGLFLTASNITLMDMTIRMSSPAGANIMVANIGSHNALVRVKFELLTAGPSGNPYFGYASLGMQNALAYNNRVQDCNFIGGDDCLGTVGYYSQLSVGTKVSGCSFGPAGSGQRGILKYCIQELSCAKTVITGCTFLDIVGTNQQADAIIYIDADGEGHHLVINDNYIENTAAPTGIEMTGGRFTTIEGNVFGRFLAPTRGVVRMRQGTGLSGTGQSAFDNVISNNQFHNQGTAHALDLDSAHSMTVNGNNITICPNLPQIILGTNTKRIKMSGNQVVYQRAATTTTSILAATTNGGGTLVNLSNPASIASGDQGSGNTGAVFEVTGGTAAVGVYDVVGVFTSVIQLSSSAGGGASVVGTLHNRPVWKITAATVAANGVDISAITTGPTAFSKYPFSSPIFAGDYVRITTATGAVIPGVYAIASASGGTTLTLATSCGGAGTITAGTIRHRPVFAATHVTENIESDISGNSACGYSDFVNPLITATDSSFGPNHAALTYTAQT